MTTVALPKQKAPIIRITAEAAQAFADLINGARLSELWSRLAFHDIRQRFRRSVLGPFWLTISMGTMVGTLGFLFSVVFRQDVAKTLPYIATRRRGFPEEGAAADREPFRPHPYRHPCESFGNDDRGVLHPPGTSRAWGAQQHRLAPGQVTSSGLLYQVP